MTASTNMDSDASEVLSQYRPEVTSASWTALGNAGGFSGARLWRATTADGRKLGLREWPTARMSEDRLGVIHRGMESMAALAFVPKLERTQAGATWVTHQRTFWEVSEWMPGTADYHQKPNDARLFAAMRSLGLMHRHLLPLGEGQGPAPAVKRILRAPRDWRALLQSGWKPDFRMPRAEPIPSLACAAWQAISSDTYSTEYTLVEWETRILPVQTCLCDIWHDHILYEGNAVTGIIDYGAVKPDCIAVDLARLLGSMIPDQPERMRQALAIYSAIHPLPEEVIRLADVLDRAGSVVGLTNWLRWIYLDKRTYSEAAGVAKRMGILLKRVESKKPVVLGPWS